MLESLKEYMNGNEEGLKALEAAQAQVNQLQGVASEAGERIKNLEAAAEHYKGEVKTLASEKGQLKESQRELEARLAEVGGGDAQAVVDKIKSEYEAKLQEATGVANQYKTKLIDTEREAMFGQLNIPFAEGLSDSDRKDAMDIIKMRLSEGLVYDENIGGHVYKDGDIIRKNGDKPYTAQEVFNNMVSQGSFSRFLNTTPSPKGAERGNVDNGGAPVKTVPRSQFDAMGQGERHAFVKDGGKVTE